MTRKMRPKSKHQSSRIHNESKEKHAGLAQATEDLKSGRTVIGWGVTISFVAVGLVVAWTYYRPIAGLVERWWTESDYVYGFLVPFVAAFLLWSRREMLHDVNWVGNWWGLLFLALAGLIRWTSSQFFYALIDPLSLVPCLIGITLILGGRNLLRWAWPGILFLVFMVPLPGFMADQLSQPLQRIGTIAGTYVIQTIGIPAVARGNVIHLPNADLGVAEACNGLRMMMLFFAVCTAMAFYVRRSLFERIVIFLSAVPIALIANISRIAVTALLYQVSSHELAERLFHDLAGFFMMPLAIVILWLEMKLMRHVIVSAPSGPMAPGIDGSSLNARGVG